MRNVLRCKTGVTFVIATLLLSACAAAPGKFQLQGSAGAEQHVFPPPPDQPRYRYVGELTGEDNFTPDDEPNAALQFGRKALKWLVGLASSKHQPVVLQRPQRGYVDASGRIFVTDVSRQAVYVFDVPAGRLHVWEMAGKNLRFSMPVGVAGGDSGELLVADAELGYIVRLDTLGEPVGTIGQGKILRPTGLATDPQTGEIYVADGRAHDIKVFDRAGELVRTLGRPGTEPGEFNAPTYLAFANGELYVTDTFNSRIQVLSPAGESRKVVGRRGLFIGDLPRPKGVAVDSNGLIYVVESFYDHLLVFNADGNLLMPIGGTGSGTGQFYLPAGVWTDTGRQVYVADMFNGRVVVFEYLGGA